METRRIIDLTNDPHRAQSIRVEMNSGRQYLIPPGAQVFLDGFNTLFFLIISDPEQPHQISASHWLSAEDIASVEWADQAA